MIATSLIRHMHVPFKRVRQLVWSFCWWSSWKEDVFLNQDVVEARCVHKARRVFEARCFVKARCVLEARCVLKAMCISEAMCVLEAMSVLFQYWFCRCLCECAGLYIWFKLESIKVNLKSKFQICVRYLCSLHYKLVISFLLETVYMERRTTLLFWHM